MPLCNNIELARLETEPFPYLVADRVLRPSVLGLMHRFWPTRDEFTPEIEHNYICPVGVNRSTLLRSTIKDTRRRLFWMAFSMTVGRSMCKAVHAHFKPWIDKRYSPSVQVSYSNMTLMEADPTYAGHHCHTHHYHGPTWVGTLLLYLDEGGQGYQGTTINKSTLNDIDAEARFAAQTHTWQDSEYMAEHTTVEYCQNRLFAMFDSPISYHSVKPALPNARGNRRIFRVHMAVSDSWVFKKYGVSPDEYRKNRVRPSESGQVVAWMRRDIDELRSASHANITLGLTPAATSAAIISGSST